MAVDYLSAINQNGSGLNTSQIVDSIVEAETAPQKALINQKIENKNLEISTMAEVALELSNLKTSVSSFANNTKLSTSSASTTATLSIQDPSVAKAFNSDVQVTQLATSQTLEFPGFSHFLQLLERVRLQSILVLGLQMEQLPIQILCFQEVTFQRIHHLEPQFHIVF